MPKIKKEGEEKKKVVIINIWHKVGKLSSHRHLFIVSGLLIAIFRVTIPQIYRTPIVTYRHPSSLPSSPVEAEKTLARF
jgi:hypothetical protein